MEDVQAAIGVLSRRLDEIEAMPGGHAKTRAIRDLADEVGRLWNRAAKIRKGEMFRIRDEEQLSLAGLAERVGISKARAGQLIEAEARSKEAGDV